MTSNIVPDEFTVTSVNERLDRDGRLDDAHGSGCYALAIDVADSVEDVERRWVRYFDVLPGNALERLAHADRTCYVGASGDVYHRLMDHARGDVRKASVLVAFSPERVIGVWPEDDPFDAERSRALALRAQGWTSWVNGEVVG